MNGYLPVGRFYRLYRIVARKNEKQRVTIINLTNRPSPPSRLPEGDLKFTGRERTKEV